MKNLELANSERRDGCKLMLTYTFPLLTGKYAVGTQLFYWTNKQCIDPETSQPRQLVVQAWYPAYGETGTAMTPYAYETIELYKRRFYEEVNNVYKFSIDNLDQIMTHAVHDVPLFDDGKSKYPVIIFGHGYGMARGNYSFFIEDLVSNGYIVLMVMHTYITALTRLESGQVIGTELMRPACVQRIEECVADIEFMLDQSISGALGQSITQAADFKNIGVIGHSLGGMVALQLCRRDARIKAGISLDGSLFGKNSMQPFFKPFLFMRNPKLYQIFINDEALLQASGFTPKTYFNSIEDFCKINGSNTTEYIVPNSGHFTFADEVFLVNFFRTIFNNQEVDLHAGNVSPVMLTMMRENIIDFFNKYLDSSCKV